MTRSPSAVQVWALQDRRHRGVPRPWVVRWMVFGREHTRAFPTRAEGDAFRAQLVTAQRTGARWDRDTGLPQAWSGSPDACLAWAQAWLARQWPTWAPRTRRSAVEALSRAVVALVRPRAPQAPVGLRLAVERALMPSGALPAPGQQWLARWGLRMDELDRATVADLHAVLGLREDGGPLAASTASRFRKVVRTWLADGAAEGKVAGNLWPPKRRGQRRTEKVRNEVDVELLPSPAQMAAILIALPTHQPGSRTYHVLSSLVWWCGLRPSEALVLTSDDLLDLPERGWGRLRVHHAWDGEGDVDADTKTGDDREVPIPPPCVALLRAWADDHPGPLFRTRQGNLPAMSNWWRALQRASKSAEQAPVSPYDLRHACATFLLRAGVPVGEVARRLGHTVEVLLRTYAGVMAGDEELGNARVAEALGWGQ